MKPEDVPDDLMELAYARFTGKAAEPGVEWIPMRRTLAAVWPEIEKRVREQVAAEIRRAAAGRRHYAERATEPGDADDYMGEAAYLEAAAEIAEESNPLAMCSLLPHELWTDAEHVARRESR